MVANSSAVPAAQPDTASGGVSLQIRGVSHGFKSDLLDTEVLDNVTLDIAAGEFIVLLGPTGCGKSTLLRLLAGLDLPVSGKIGVDHVRIVGPDPSRLLAFQDPTLYPWLSVRKNILFGLQARGIARKQAGRVEEVLRLVKLDGFADALPHQLSGGMAQRAALARALVHDPRLLLLDEPFGKLDALTRMTMQSEMLKLWQSAGFTAVLVTHDVEEALLLGQRIVMLTSRPARVLEVLDVDLPYPRHRDDPRLVSLRRSILSGLGHADDI